MLAARLAASVFALVLLAAGCVSPAPLGTEGAEPFAGANTVVLDVLDQEDAVARLAAAGWPVGERSERAFTTGWRAPERQALRIQQVSYRLTGAVVPGDAEDDRLVLRGEMKLASGTNERTVAIRFEGDRSSEMWMAWEMLARASEVLGGARLYARM